MAGGNTATEIWERSFMLPHAAQPLSGKGQSYLSPSLISALIVRTPRRQQHSSAQSCSGESWQGHRVFKRLLPTHTVSTCCHRSLSKSSAGSLAFHRSDWKRQQTWQGRHASAAAGEDLREGFGQTRFTSG